MRPGYRGPSRPPWWLGRASRLKQLSPGNTGLELLENAAATATGLFALILMAPDGEVCVCDFVEPVGKSQPTVSHHMKILSDAGLVHGERRSKWVYYSLDRMRLAGLRAAIDS